VSRHSCYPSVNISLDLSFGFRFQELDPRLNAGTLRFLNLEVDSSLAVRDLFVMRVEGGSGEFV
jgi:hypothetical protein